MTDENRKIKSLLDSGFYLFESRKFCAKWRNYIPFMEMGVWLLASSLWLVDWYRLEPFVKTDPISSIGAKTISLSFIIYSVQIHSWGPHTHTCIHTYILVCLCMHMSKRERERERKKESYTCTHAYILVCLCMHVYKRERERERERDRES